LLGCGLRPSLGFLSDRSETPSTFIYGFHPVHRAKGELSLPLRGMNGLILIPPSPSWKPFWEPGFRISFLSGWTPLLILGAPIFPRRLVGLFVAFLSVRLDSQGSASAEASCVLPGSANCRHWTRCCFFFATFFPLRLFCAAFSCFAFGDIVISFFSCLRPPVRPSGPSG